MAARPDAAANQPSAPSVTDAGSEARFAADLSSQSEAVLGTGPAFALPAARIATLGRIVLTGFMGAGKTTVGRLLASRLQLPFVDVDDQIVAMAGLTIPDIFRLHGEPAFRELEHQAILRLLAGEPLVIAMGGGAIEDDRTRSILLSRPGAQTGTRLVYLESSLQTTLARCGPPETGTRPILADRVNLEARYLKRLPLYRQSHFTVAVDELSPAAVVEAILLLLESSQDPE